MLRLSEFRLAATKRRGLRLFFIISFSIIIISGILLLWMGIFGFRTELVSIGFQDDIRDDSFAGAGLNIDYVPSVNLIRDASFETGYEYVTLEAADFDGRNIYFKSDSVKGSRTDLANLAGGDLRILGSDTDGVMRRKYTGSVESYYPESMAEVTDIITSVAGGVISGVADVEVYGNCVTVLSDEGVIYADIQGATPIKTGGNELIFTCLASSGDICYAVASDGTIYEASDGRTFVAVTDKNEEISNVGSCVAVANKLLILNREGQLYLYNGELFSVDLPEGGAPSCIGRLGEIFVAVNDKGIHYSDNGYVFRIMSDAVIPKEEIADLAMSDEILYIVKLNGDLVICSAEGITEKEAIFETATPVIRSAVCNQNGKLFVSTSDRVAMSYDRDSAAYSIISTVDTAADDLLAGIGDGFIYSSGVKLYKASVLSLIRLAESVAPDSIGRGDICSVKIEPTLNVTAPIMGDRWESLADNMLWDICGKGTSASYTSDAVSGGRSLKIVGTGNTAHVISQKLPGTSKDNFIPDNFYRLRFDVKTTEDVNVTCWLEGERFGRIAFAGDVPKAAPRTLSTLFAVTDNMAGDDTVRLYISFEGDATVMIDDVYLGPDNGKENYIPAYLTDSVRNAAPSAVRLGGIVIGSNGYSPDVMYAHSRASLSHDIDIDGNTARISSCDSLEDCLDMVSDAGADPWLVIGSCAAEADIDNLMSYMCGPVSEGYGARRVANGTAVPWSRKFDRIYIEIADTDGAFTTDAARGGYVDYTISLIEQSEYYPAIKEKVVFLDGMNYEGGIRLSSADSHALSVNATDIMETGNSDDSYMINVASFFDKINTEAERSKNLSDSGQYISSLSLAESSNCAEYTAMFLCEQAGFVELPMMNVAIDYKPSLYESEKMFADGKSALNLFATMKMISDVTSGSSAVMYIPELTDPMDLASKESVEDLEKACGIYALSGAGGDKYLIIANCSNDIRQFVVSSSGSDLFNSYATRYSSSGKVVSAGKFGKLFNRRVLNPGEVLIIKVENR
ncbi:MAG: hypothetical protein J6X33_06655 [Clostridiales bacterium]|nr:hypothetical protein [Clostridiales bacterium]